MRRNVRPPPLALCLITVLLVALRRQTVEVDSGLHPVPAAAGSLASAPQQLAAERGVDLTVVPHEGGSPVTAGIATPVPGRKPLLVHIRATSRWFGVSGRDQGTELITGATPEPADVVGAGAAWAQDGGRASGLFASVRGGGPGGRAGADQRRPTAWETPTKIFSQISPKPSPETQRGPDPQ